MFLYVLSTITFQTFSGSFSRHRSLKETSIWLTDLQVSVSVQTGTFQKIANNIYIMEMPILGLMIPKKNAAVCNGMTIVLYEMEGATWHQNLRVFLPRFPRWAVYEMMLVFPFHTGHGFLPFHTGTVKGDQNCWVENAHQEEESFFPFSVLLISSSAAADQWSSFRVACAVDRILSRNKLKFF